MRNIDTYQAVENDLQNNCYEVMEDCLPPDLVAEYKEAFQILDKKRTGKISVRDVSAVVCSIGIQLKQSDLIEYVSQILESKEIDINEKCIGFSQFLATMTTVLTDCISDDEIMRIFKEFDKDGDGYISPNELQNLLLRLGDDVSDDDIKEMMQVADMDGDGRVSLEEFIHVMTPPKLNNNREAHSQPEVIIEDSEMPKPMPSSDSDINIDRMWSDCRLDNSADSQSTSDSDSDSFSNNDQCTYARHRKVSSNKRRKSIVDWLKGRPSKSCEPSKFCVNESIEQITRSTTSVTSSNASFSGNSSSNLRERRRSSIGRTLRNGRQALLATARTLRKISR